MKEKLIILITLLLLVSSFPFSSVHVESKNTYPVAATKTSTGWWSDYSSQLGYSNANYIIGNKGSEGWVNNNQIYGDMFLSNFRLDSTPYTIINNVEVRVNARYDLSFTRAWSDGTYLFAGGDSGLYALNWSESDCQTIDFDFWNLGYGDYYNFTNVKGLIVEEWDGNNYVDKTYIIPTQNWELGWNLPTYNFDYENECLTRVCHGVVNGSNTRNAAYIYDLSEWWRPEYRPHWIGSDMVTYGIVDYPQAYIGEYAFVNGRTPEIQPYWHLFNSLIVANGTYFKGIGLGDSDAYGTPWCFTTLGNYLYAIRQKNVAPGYYPYSGGGMIYHMQATDTEYTDLIVPGGLDSNRIVTSSANGLRLWHHWNGDFVLIDAYDTGTCDNLEEDGNYIYCINGNDILVVDVSGGWNITEIARASSSNVQGIYPVTRNGHKYVFAMRGSDGIDCYKLNGSSLDFLWNYKYGDDGYYVELTSIKNEESKDTFRFDVPTGGDWSSWVDITDYVGISNIGSDLRSVYGRNSKWPEDGDVTQYYFNNFYLELYAYKSEEGLYPMRTGKVEGMFDLFAYQVQIRIDSTDEHVVNLETSEYYQEIQPAIDEASAGDHIYVINGTFYEDLTIDKPLTLEGSNADVIIDGQGDEWGWGNFIDITAEDVTITNLTLRYGEINLINANRARFLRNNLSTVHIQFDESDFCVFQFNNFTHYADIGIEDYSNNNTIYNNNFWIDTLGWDEPPDGPFTNCWNQTYPRGGNFWEQFPIDYGPTLKDIYSGPNQDIPGSDGIWDEPYELGRDGNKDWYPLVNPIDFDNIPDPPIFSGITPADGASEPYTTSSVSIDIEDLEGEYPIDWLITGDYVQTDSGTIYSPTTITASLDALPYNTQIVWTVTATDSGGDIAIASYSFTTLPYSVNSINYVDASYTPADPQYRKTHWDTLQGAIDTVDDGGTIYIASGTYNENVFINKSCHLIGNNNLTTIIQGTYDDWTIEVGEVEYPGFPSKISDVTLENLTIRNEWRAPTGGYCLLFRYVGNIRVTNCIFQYGWEGLSVDGDCDNVTIRNCRFTDLRHNGIYTAATDTDIENNVIENCDGSGIQVGTFALNTLIQDNYIYGSGTYGVYINGAGNTTVKQNIIRRSIFGLGNVNADNSLIYNNNFIDNWQQATDNDGGTGTRWNYTYPTGGNYWSDFDTPVEGAYDNYYGAGQDLAGGDGIVDKNSPNPYPIPGGTQQDNYPLMDPWPPVHCMNGDFYWSPYYPEPNQTVYFYESTCSQNVLESKWNFGDGTIKTTTKSSVDHPYSKPGYYNVSLTITDLYGQKDTTTKQLYVGYPPHIPPIQPPKYPAGFTVEEMYKLLKADKLSKTMNKVTIMIIDSGVTPRTYNGIDLSKITRMYDPSFTSGNDENGHGTWCCYAIAYILAQKAPNAQIISYKVFDKNGGTSMEAMLKALDKALSMHVDVVSLSAGASQGRTDDPLSLKCEELRKAGIIVIVAAGNSGPLPSTILSPGVSDSVIAIAAEDPIMKGSGAPTTERTTGILDLKDDLIEIWSSRGPVKGVSPKPDATAPGESIRGPWLSQEKVVSGTSMATPFIAGGTAVIVAENKDTINKVKIKSKIPELYEQAIKETCYKKGNANDWGEGIVQFDAVSKNFKGKLDDYILWEQMLMTYLLWLLLLIIIAIIIYYYYKKRKQKKNHLPKWFK